MKSDQLIELEAQVQSLRYYIAYPDLLSMCMKVRSLDSWLNMEDIDIIHELPKIHHLLNGNPATKDQKVLALWSKQRRLTIDQFQMFWQRVSDDDSGK